MIMILALLAFMFICLCCMSIMLVQIVGDIRMSAIKNKDGSSDLSRVSYIAMILMVEAGMVGAYITFAFAAIQLGVTPV